MPTQTVKFTIECEVEIKADAVLDDYGVPNSPKFYSYENEDFANIYIDIGGDRVLLKDIPKGLRDTLWDHMVDNIDERAWE